MQPAAQTRSEGDGKGGEPPRRAAAEPVQQSSSQHLAVAMLASFAAGAACGYWLGRVGAPRQSVITPCNKSEPAGQHAHAADSEASWQKEHALARDELQASSRAMAAALEAEAPKPPGDAAMDMPTVLDERGCGEACSNGRPEGVAASTLGPEGNGGQEQPAALGKGEDDAAGSLPPGAAAEESSAGECLVPVGMPGEGDGAHTPSAVPSDSPLERAPDALESVGPSTPETRLSHAATPDRRGRERDDNEVALCSTSGRAEGVPGRDAGHSSSVMPWPWAAANTNAAGSPKQKLEMEQWDSAAAFWEAFTRQLKVRALTATR